MLRMVCKHVGPIIRISPHELHVNDPEFYETLYSQHSPRDKSRFLLNIFDLHMATFGTEKHDVHRIRRASLNPFFSKQRIFRLEPVIQSLARRFCERCEDFKRAGQPVPLTFGFSCLITDVLTEYVMTESFHYLEAPDWVPQWVKTLRSIPEVGIWAKYVPGLLPLLKSVPQSWVAVMDPGMGMVMGYNKTCEAKIRDIMSEREKATQKAGQKMSALPTLFNELLDSDLPPEEKTFARLADECQSVIGAGTETTTHALEVIAYHLLDNPGILQKLRDELDQVNPDRSVQLPFRDLEQLPYLVREDFNRKISTLH
jgi:cytochrome P450